MNRRLFLQSLALLAASLPAGGPARAAAPVRVGMTGEFGIPGSTSAQAIQRGIQVALREINQQGGVLGGRPLELVSLDDRGVPARAKDNLAELAAKPDLVAVFGGKFSPVALELGTLARQLKLPLLLPWSAANDIIDRLDTQPWLFRLSLRDDWAMRHMAEALRKARLGHQVGVLLPNTSWGRSCQESIHAYAARHPDMKPQIHWYNWGDSDMLGHYRALLDIGMEALILVANEHEGALLVKQLTGQPTSLRRVPILSHWGISGGNFVSLAGEGLHQLDLRVVQTFTFADPATPKRQAVAASYQALFGEPVQSLLSQVGFAHAYDLTHLLALAIRNAGSTDRSAIRPALEKSGRHPGLVRQYDPAFTPRRHEALGPENIFLARFNRDGTLSRVRS